MLRVSIQEVRRDVADGVNCGTGDRPCIPDRWI